MKTPLGQWFLIAGILSQVACAHLSSDLSAVATQDLNDPGSQIVGGRPALVNDPVSKMAALILISRSGKNSVCTGVPIKQRVILTAAHCVFGADEENIRVGFGPNQISAQKIIIHESYDGSPQSYADLALIVLTENIPASYAPFEICERVDEVKADEITLVGYGISGNKEKDAMLARTIDKSLKRDLHIKEKIIGIDQRAGGGGFCRGDSGAPIFAMVGTKRKVIGINSFTVGITENEDCNTASVSMSMPYFAAWLKTKTVSF